MSDNVAIASADANAAWARYQAMAVRLLDQPSLLIDRAFRERLYLVERAWTASFEAYARTLDTQKGQRV